jgi:Rps23 Pro-64 3,4-dihydroxylase Tpa1-like proline 4-hydroxylase
MRSFLKALKDLDREIAIRENSLSKQRAEIQVMRNRYEAMREFISKMYGDKFKAGRAKGIPYERKNLFPKIVEFLRNNPNSTARQIREAVNGSDTLIRYHINKQSKFFKRTKNEEGLSLFSLTAKAARIDDNSFSVETEA